MRLTRSAVLFSTAVLAVVDLWGYGALASSEEDEELDMPADVDLADLDGLDEDYGSLPSLSELAKSEQAKQKEMLEAEGQAEDEPVFNAEEEEFEVASEEAEEEQPVVVLDDEEAEHVDNKEDLEGDPEKPPQPEGESAVPGSPKEAAAAAEDAEGSQGPKKYGGQVVATEDEEGVTLDTSSLNREQEQASPDIQEYLDNAVKYKKEEEEKKKRKEEFKKKKEDNNEINYYEKELEVFQKAEEKNKNRFDEEVQNAEENLRAPTRPNWWKRLKHSYNVFMDRLVDKYGSKQED